MAEEKFYIDYKQLGTLLNKYPSLKALLRNLQIEFEKLVLKTDDKPDPKGAITEDEILYTLAIGNRVLSDMPHSQPSPGDKMTSIILRKDIMIQDTYPHELMRTIHIIAEVVEKITVALNGLTERERSIVELRNFECKDWGEVSSKMTLERAQLGQVHKEALEKMVKIVRVTFEQLEFCMERVR